MKTSAISNQIRIERLTKENFNPDDLQSFNRRQIVEDVYVLRNGQLALIRRPFVDDWTPLRKTEKALEILSGQYIVYGAFETNRVVGEIMLVPRLHEGRMIVDSFHVDADYRRRGIGRELFVSAKREAKAAGASDLYISACSAKETIEFYKAMGCRVSENPIPRYAEAEPCDIQMECAL